jgi:hypothetical protein
LGASVFWGGMLVGAELRRGNGAFIFNSSHVALLTGDLVRARSVVQTLGASVRFWPLAFGS